MTEILIVFILGVSVGITLSLGIVKLVTGYHPQHKQAKGRLIKLDDYRKRDSL